MPPSTFFTTASHYFVSAHRRSLPPGQKLLTVPTPLEKELIVNTHFRSLRRRGAHVINALKLWYEYGAKSMLPNFTLNGRCTSQSQGGVVQQSIFTTVYS